MWDVAAQSSAVSRVPATLGLYSRLTSMRNKLINVHDRHPQAGARRARGHIPTGPALNP